MPRCAFACFALAYPGILVTQREPVSTQNSWEGGCDLAPGSYRDGAVEVKCGCPMLFTMGGRVCSLLKKTSKSMKVNANIMGECAVQKVSVQQGGSSSQCAPTQHTRHTAMITMMNSHCVRSGRAGGHLQCGVRDCRWELYLKRSECVIQWLLCSLGPAGLGHSWFFKQ